MPGVLNQSAGSAVGTGGYTTSNVMSVNGLTTNTTFYALDGIWNENTGNMNQLSVTPNPDSLPALFRDGPGPRIRMFPGPSRNGDPGPGAVYDAEGRSEEGDIVHEHTFSDL